MILSEHNTVVTIKININSFTADRIDLRHGFRDMVIIY